MIGTFDVVVVAKGRHGPFKRKIDPETGELEGGRGHYPFVDLAAQDGSGTAKATLAPELISDTDEALWNPPLFTPLRVRLELRGKDSSPRCHGEAQVETAAQHITAAA